MSIYHKQLGDISDQFLYFEKYFCIKNLEKFQIPYSSFMKSLADDSPIELKLSRGNCKPEYAQTLVEIAGMFDHEVLLAHKSMKLTVGPEDDIDEIEDVIKNPNQQEIPDTKAHHGLYISF
jgi:hypothetical protein